MSICIAKGCKCLHHELLASIELKNNGKAKLFLEAIANFHEITDNSGLTFLHYAVKYKNKTIVQYLIDKGCNINARDDNDATPLEMAITNNIVSMIDILLENNANTYESKNILPLVLNKCIDSYIKTNKKIYQPITKIFKKINADFLSEQCGMVLSHLCNHYYARFSAVVFGNSKLTKCILDNDYPHYFTSENINNCTALHCAIMCARMKNAKMLIEYGSNVNALDKLERIPLYYYSNRSASADVQFEILKHLLKSCADPNPSDHACSAFKHLIVHGNKEIVKAVMQSGMSFTQCFKNVGCLLELLILNDNPDVIDVLEELNIGFYANAICKDEKMSKSRLGNRVLSLAVKNGCVKKVKFLLEHEADVKGILGESHLALIAIYDLEKNSRYRLSDVKPATIDTEIIELLLQYGDNNQLSNRTDWDKLESCYGIKNKFYLKAILAHLALLEVLDKSPLKDIQYFMNGNWLFKDQYNLYIEEAKKTKDIEVLDKITLFDLLLEKDQKKFVQYARNDDFIFKFFAIMNDITLDVCYTNILRRNLQRGIYEIELERSAAKALEALTGLYTVVVHHIISYLSNKDRQNVCLAESIVNNMTFVTTENSM